TAEAGGGCRSAVTTRLTVDRTRAAIARDRGDDAVRRDAPNLIGRRARDVEAAVGPERQPLRTEWRISGAATVSGRAGTAGAIASCRADRRAGGPSRLASAVAPVKHL